MSTSHKSIGNVDCRSGYLLPVEINTDLKFEFHSYPRQVFVRKGILLRMYSTCCNGESTNC
jgi:hypothetical protein